MTCEDDHGRRPAGKDSGEEVNESVLYYSGADVSIKGHSQRRKLCANKALSWTDHLHTSEAERKERLPPAILLFHPYISPFTYLAASPPPPPAAATIAPSSPSFTSLL